MISLWARRPDGRLMANAIALDRFATELEGLDTPRDCLDALQAAVRPTINVYAAWRAPMFVEATGKSYAENRNTFFHASITPEFRKEFWPIAHKFGPSPMSGLARQQNRLLTWTEGMRQLALRGQDSWLFDLARKHGMRDGAYVPYGPWMIGYWSPKTLRGLSGRTRACLFIAAGFTAQRLDEIIPREKINGAIPALTGRQRGALRMISRGHTIAEIGERMEVSPHTVRDYLDAARKKLGARDAHHAAFLALRLNLIV